MRPPPRSPPSKTSPPKPSRSAKTPLPPPSRGASPGSPPRQDERTRAVDIRNDPNMPNMNDVDWDID
jgi:hypothetical protein